ncbi:MarR family winged helix-turn-helix transcriptional regulator [Actinomadura macra]|uniref:MarR family winged helix-turn-helix transcriptional regulator n=1 Tax=Actinomadura macra TaxID=46164 RepID=UPI000AF10AD8|nr:MarR family winged helix-turn-helix transcriptional regulator [Actinomadura macra]
MQAEGELPIDVAPPVAQGGTDLDRRLVAALERAGHVVRTLLWRQAYANGLSPIQTQLLLHLVGKAQPPRVSDLAAEFDVSLATMSDALAALRRKELVRRDRDPGDRRSHIFVLTDSGARLADELAHWSDPVTGWLGAGPEADKAATLRFLLDLIGRLHDAGVLAVARTCVTCQFFVRNAHDDPARPHHCRLLDTPFGDAALRVDCAEHQPREHEPSQP